MDPATVGSLLGITKSLIEIIRGIGSFFPGTSNNRDKLKTGFGQLYGRIAALAVQLEQCENLTRMVPAWLELANRMPLWQTPSSVDQREAQILDRDLRSLVNDSIRDHFSATFFRANFDQLPDVPVKLDIFRDRLRSLDRTISTLPPGNLLSLQALWPQITTQFNDTRNSAYEILRIAEDLQGRLIQELREAAQHGLADVATA